MIYFDAYTCFGPRPSAHAHQPWSLSHLVDELAHCSISGALVASTEQALYDPMLANRRLCTALAPHAHLFPIWTVMPHWTGESPPPQELTRQMAEQGVRAVQLLPRTNVFDLLSETTVPLLQELARTRTLTILEAAEADAPSIERVLGRFADLPLLLWGGSWGQQRLWLPLVLHHRNLHLTFTHIQGHRTLEWLVAKGCADQLLFASNAPTMAAGAHRAYVDWAEVPTAVRAQVASGNLVRLLKGQCPPAEVNNADEDELMAEVRRGRPLACLTLDMHAHVLDEGLDGAGGQCTMFDGGPSGVRRLARRAGVDGIGLMSWNGLVGVDPETGNRCVRDALDAYPDYFWGLATFDIIHETAESMQRQMEAVFADARFLGLKPYPTFGIPYDDPRWDVWWQFGHDHGLYVGVHPTRWYEPDEFASICERFPDLTVVAYHAGSSYAVADTVIDLARRFPNFMAEPTLTPVCGGIIDYLVRGAGPQRILYGSDSPMRDPRQQLGWIVFSRLTLEEKRMVLGANASRLLAAVRRRRNGPEP